ncbi:hypothetical protein SAMN05421663_104158 [Terribacillus halophilus]|uniref:Uncharacterized protein n=1 Tax=Terribacillus halophilus TaxID=361279 RepID=A0A1G6PJQ1_9BACI|nr:hypothetical protein [Terribacillus halophilus]SDC80393.1 hypothetical protein SAMN05421663_104158 [Terribacillus halophilus]
MAQIKDVAYQDLRKYIQNNWKYIALQNENGTEVIRLSPTDNRVQWIHDVTTGEPEYDDYDNPIPGTGTTIITTNILKLQIVLSGSDSEINNGTTVAQTAIYNVAVGGEPFTQEVFEPFTFGSDQDKLTVVHEILVPTL